MKTMNGTIHSTSGFPVITASRPKLRLRLLGLIVTAVIGCLLVLGVTQTTWNELDYLQHEFGALKADSFYAGVRIRQ